MASTHHRGLTEAKIDEFTYEWEIKNFRHLHHENGKYVESPPFSVGCDEVTWCLNFYPQGHGKNDSDYVSIYLSLTSLGSATSGIGVNFEISILKSNAVLMSNKGMHIYEKTGGRGWPQIMKRQVLLAACEINDSFMIRCKLERSLSIVTKPLDPIQPIPFNLTNHRLADDCRQLLKRQDQFTDVTIIARTKTFPAHKVLLAARSSVFTAMFNNEKFKENLTSEVKINDIEPQIVEAMLEFIYTDQVSNISELAEGLLAAAEKYDLELLKAMCGTALCKALEVHNAVHALELADLYNCPQLAQYAIKFITDNFSEVIKSEAYQKLENPNILKKLVCINEHKK